MNNFVKFLVILRQLILLIFCIFVFKFVYELWTNWFIDNNSSFFVKLFLTTGLFVLGVLGARSFGLIVEIGKIVGLSNICLLLRSVLKDNPFSTEVFSFGNLHITKEFSKNDQSLWLDSIYQQVLPLLNDGSWEGFKSKILQNLTTKDTYTDVIAKVKEELLKEINTPIEVNPWSNILVNHPFLISFGFISISVLFYYMFYTGKIYELLEGFKTLTKHQLDTINFNSELLNQQQILANTIQQLNRVLDLKANISEIIPIKETLLSLSNKINLLESQTLNPSNLQALAEMKSVVLDLVDILTQNGIL